MTDVTDALKSLHLLYVRVTGYKLEFSFRRLMAWEVWSSKGWTENDLLLVLRFLQNAIRTKRRWGQCLNFSSLIEKTDVFEEHLAEAKARGRIPRIDEGKAAVLRATGRMEEAKAKPRSVEQVLRDDKAFAEFQKFRASL